MKNEELLIHIDNKFDEVHGRISKIDKNMSKIWANTVCQYMLLGVCLICFLVYNYKIENITQRIDILFGKVNTTIDISNNTSNNNTSKSNSKNYNSKTENSSEKNTSLFGK